MKTMFILADDLSGAADCAISCVSAGLTSAVLLEGDITGGVADVIAIDLNSRALREAQARKLSAEMAARAYEVSTDLLLYKKFDSTLRGHVGAEIAGCIEASAQARLAIVAPAFPATGRTTQGGQVFIDGVALQETEVWQRSGMSGSGNLQVMLTEAGLRCALIGLDEVRSEPQALIRTLEGQLAQGIQVVVCDAVTDEDLSRLAAAACTLETAPILAGSAGFAQQLARNLGHGRLGATERPSLFAGDKPVLIAVGSRSSVSRTQARRLIDANPHILDLAISSQLLRAGKAAPIWADVSSRLQLAASSNQDVLVSIAMGDEVDIREGPFLAQAFAQLVGEVLPDFGALIATGGETARALLGQLNASTLHLVRELEPGVTLGETSAPNALAVVTKAGAFGRPCTLLNAWQALNALRKASQSAAS